MICMGGVRAEGRSDARTTCVENNRMRGGPNAILIDSGAQYEPEPECLDSPSPADER